MPTMLVCPMTPSRVAVVVGIRREFGLEIGSERSRVDSMHAGPGQSLVNQFQAGRRLERRDLKHLRTPGCRHARTRFRHSPNRKVPPQSTSFTYQLVFPGAKVARAASITE